MSRPLLRVDFNEMLEADLVLLSAGDQKPDAHGQEILLRDGLEIDIYDDDFDDRGEPDPLLARGVVERNAATAGFAAHVKWCCRIGASGIRHRSELSQ